MSAHGAVPGLARGHGLDECGGVDVEQVRPCCLGVTCQERAHHGVCSGLYGVESVGQVRGHVGGHDGQDARTLPHIQAAVVGVHGRRNDDDAVLASDLTPTT